jgi:hypothetical protein
MLFDNFILCIILNKYLSLIYSLCIFVAVHATKKNSAGLINIVIWERLMKIKLPIYLFFVFMVCTSYSQTKIDSSFEQFAEKQNLLMVKACENKDTAQYKNLFNEFFKRYESLDDSNKKQFKSALTDAYYNFACTYSLTNNKKLALDYLDKAITSGFYNYSHIMQDKDLDLIRNENRFKTSTDKIRSIGDYLYVLRRGEKYDNLDKREVPAFTYQESSNQHLAELRKAFNLDSVAGSGNEVSKILSMMHWIHNLIPHDGNYGNPDIKNALSMINICKKENKTLNCRGLAIVLNECYLAMGFKSRFVTCLPKDSLKIDGDCHVIDMVYSNSLKKWIWIDPTFDAYVMNEKGELLGIGEVRDRIINDQPLILNPDANWNHKSSQSKEYYLNNYMTKNLYILECPASSEYNYETSEKNKVREYIRLTPLDYFKQKPDSETTVNEKLNSKLIKYVSNNAESFWAAPTK